MTYADDAPILLKPPDPLMGIAILLVTPAGEATLAQEVSIRIQ